MSKALPITLPVAIATAGVAATAAGLAAVGARAIWLARKAHEKWKSIPVEDRAYLLPFGTDAERHTRPYCEKPHEPPKFLTTTLKGPRERQAAAIDVFLASLAKLEQPETRTG